MNECRHEESLYGRCSICGKTWEGQARDHDADLAALRDSDYGRYLDMLDREAEETLARFRSDMARPRCTCGGRPDEIGGADHRPGCGVYGVPETDELRRIWRGTPKS